MQIRDPIVELHETQLYRALTECDPEYAQRITQFVSAVAPIMATTERHFPYFTRHDAHHGFRVVRRMEQVVKKSCLEAGAENAFSAVEIFLLIAAAYAHDLGMTVFPGEADELLGMLKLEQTPGWETHPDLQRHLRREHSRRGGDFILKNSAMLGVPLNLVNALDTMMKAHNLAVSDLEALNVVYAAQEREFEIRQLAAIICVGDALEFSDTRVMEGVLDRIQIDPSDSARVSYRENMKHVCVGDSLAVDNEGRVIVSGTFQEEEVLGLAHFTLDQMEDWVQGYCDIDRRMKQPRFRIRPEVFSRNLVFTGGQFERLGVRLNKKSVIDLIASNAVWRTSAGIAVRELIQNAVEACRYRVHHSGPADRYVPAVRVEFDRGNHTISVSDNGCGMSERTVLNHFLTVGSSRSKTAGYMETDYAPIARFGIGFWSVFTIARTARIETAAFEPCRGSPASAMQASGISFEVSLDELKEYTVFRPVTRHCGTQVVLTLRNDAVFDDVVAQGRGMLLCSEIPVSLSLDGEEIEVSQSVPDVSDHDILGSRNRVMGELGVQIFRWRGTVNATELALALAYRVVDGKASFLADSSSSLMTAIGGLHHPKTSVCGFSVPVHPDPLCIDLMRIGVFFANHRSPDGFEFSLDRQQLLVNAASQRFSREITDLFHAGYRAFLTATNSQDAATISALRDQAQMNGGNVYDAFTGLELSSAAERFPDLLCFRLLPVQLADSGSPVIPVHVNLDELRKLRGTVYTLQKGVDRPIQGGRYIGLNVEDPRILAFTYNNVRAIAAADPSTQPAYVMEVDRRGSMLFDADPESSVRFINIPSFDSLCIQVMKLERARFNTPPENILAQVQGRWSGAIYLRAFNTPDATPYLFLGRYRVLIERSSRLAQHLQELMDAGKRTRLAEVIADLKEAEAGYPPAAIVDLL
ncbi:ATP-binding protein [Variovorax sp. VaC1]|uniref:HD domain-containing protein n=1 Tax=Variovorax sp. VaC1 TaxID=3373132 RepID=UPI00374A8592